MNDKEMGRGETVNLWQMIEQSISKLNNRLNEIERRLGRIESQQTMQTILNETQVVEEPSLLGGRTLLASASGTFEKIIRLPACDICGKRLGQEFIICYNCGKKLCEKCIVPFDNKNYCIECLKERLPLSKKSFKVLVSIANEITNIEAISELTRMSKEEVRNSLDELLKLKLIAKKGASIFSSIQATDNGIEAIGAFRQMYKEDEDVTRFDLNLQKRLGGMLY